MKPSPETRYTLIEKIKNPEDAEAWSEFTSIYQPLIFRICRSKGMQHADATDVTQEVMARVATAIEKFRHDHAGATFRGWLYRITRNLVVDFFRQRDKNVLASADAQSQIGIERAPDAEEAKAFELEFRRQIFVHVAAQVQASVKPKTWMAFWQTEMEHRPVDEVAEDLQMTAGAIYVARSRIIARLKETAQKKLNETTQNFV